MTRRIYRKPQVTVSLFPFLAVLVCTMGALIVLLVLVVQQARVHATVVKTDSGPTDEELAAAEELELAREDSQWRREILEQQRLAMTAQQSDHRLQLSHLEEHIRRLEQKWKQLEEAASELQSTTAADAQSRETADAELTQLRAAIDQARQDLDAAKRAADQRPRSFAIIPYRGPHGTQRRPIFIECTARGIVLQPEGLVITAADLNGPLGPGNPLDAALRAIREYLVGNGVVGKDSEPYPLLVVRPDGTEAYGAARNAMKSWDDEFGYELIEADVKLEYPVADPVLRDLVAKSLADARQRQELLAAAMPSQFGGRGGGSGGGGSGGFGGGGFGGGGMVATPYRGGFVPAQQASRGRPDGSTRGTGSSGGNGTGTRSSQDRATADGTASRGSSSNANTAGGSPSQLATGRSDTSGSTGNPLCHGSPGESTDGQAGGGQPSGGQAGRSDGQAGGANGSSSGGSSSGRSLQASRGVDWALPQSARNATGVTRPVRVACWPDRLLILPEQGNPNNARTVTVKHDLADHIDEFVEEIWNHADGWGLALAGGYWKPVVNVEVAPGGEPMFVELERLMEGSGLEVKRKSW